MSLGVGRARHPARAASSARSRSPTASRTSATSTATCARCGSPTQTSCGRTTVGKDVDASCLIVDDKLYVGVEEAQARTFHCIDRESGEACGPRTCRRACGRPRRSGRTRSYVGGNNGKHVLPRPDTGDEKWTYKSGAGIWDVAVGGRRQGAVRRLRQVLPDGRRRDGKELWKYDIGDRCHSGCAIEDGHFWVGGASGYYYCFGT